MELDKIKEILSKTLSEKRYNHSLGVMKLAKKLAKIYGEDEKQAEFAGLIHDIAKEMPREKIEQYINSHKIEVDDIEKIQIGLLHAKIGAHIAKEEFGACEKTYNAIKYHTTGDIKMDTFAKIIFVADKIEENRDYEGVEERRELAKEDLDSVILEVLNDTIQKSLNKRKLIHPNTIDLRNYLLMKYL